MSYFRVEVMKKLLCVLSLILAGALTQSAMASLGLSADELRTRWQELKPGQFLWYPEVSPEGPITLVVSLTEQRAYVYRNGIVIGVTTVSTGKKGHETPTGVFSILQKKVKHQSNLYSNSPMPYMQRLTWDGIALHAGRLPGYPASHGCIRLPMPFAKKLYAVTGFSSTTVIIADRNNSPQDISHPGLLAPAVQDGQPMSLPVTPGEIYWNDPGEEEGTLSILISRADLRAYVYRGGKRIGTAPITVPDGSNPSGISVFSLLEKPSTGDIERPDPQLHWSVVQVGDAKNPPVPANQLSQIYMDPAFVRILLSSIDVGSTLIITDLPSNRHSRSGSDFTVISTEK